jgi:hypothetical protein
MTTTIDSRWRIALALGGATMAIGGPLHPESDAADPLRDELATMTAGDTWVLSHSLVAVGTVLLATGLWAAHRAGVWPASTRAPLRVAAIALAAYVVETIFHLAAVIDSDALAAGDPAPVAFTHIGLALVLYPISGLAFAWLNLHVFRAVALPEKVFGVVGVVAGVLHAVVIPLLLLFPDLELTPMFAASGMLIAGWSLGVGISGLRTAARPSLTAAVQA